MEVALFRLLESWGVRPDHVLGHSVGELAAAHVSGALSLRSACAVVAIRARLMGALPTGGAMAAVAAGEAEIVPLLGPDVAIAAVNGPESVVVSGATDQVAALLDDLAGRGRRVRRLVVSHAFHSPLMEPMLDEFRAALGELESDGQQIPVVSCRVGAPVDAKLTDVEHWVEHVRAPVRFADGVRALAAAGVTRFVEIGPGGSLAAMVPGALADPASTPESGPDPVVVPTLRGGRDERAALVRAIAELHAAGVPVDWTAFFAGTASAPVDLPTYPFQRERFWPVAGAGGSGDAAGLGLVPLDHPLLGAAAEPAERGATIVAGRLSVAAQPWLADHVLGDVAVFPGTGFLELVLRAADQVGCDRVEELTLSAPLVLDARDGVAVQVWIGEPDDAGVREVRVHSRSVRRPEDGWTRHADGTIRVGERVSEMDTEQWPPAGAVELDVAGHYDSLADSGLVYGPVFRGLRTVWRVGEDICAEVALPERLDGRSPEAGEFGLHPALLDAALQASAFVPANEGRNLMPFSWRGVSLHAGGASVLRVRWSQHPTGLRLRAVDPAGDPVISVESLALRAPTQSPGSTGQDVRDTLLTVDWPVVQTTSRPETPVGSSVLLEPGASLPAGEVPDFVCLPVGGADPADSAGEASRVLAVLREWLGDGRFAGSCLVLVTRGAVGPVVGSGVDVGGGAVWGLVR
ncbi:modular polyketide synthase, partial [Amycolatopsis antarctica]